MNTKQRSTYYTAVGHFRRKTGADGKSYPVILVNQEEHRVDIQETAVWTILNRWVLHLDQIEAEYSQMARELPPPAATMWAGPAARRKTSPSIPQGTFVKEVPICMGALLFSKRKHYESRCFITRLTRLLQINLHCRFISSINLICAL